MRILLDSNVWRYAVDNDAIAAIEKAAYKSVHSIVVAPSVLYEAASASDTMLRQRLLAAMCRPTWKRLMPEAYRQCEEIKQEVRQLRPGWLRVPPDLTLFRRLRHNWVRSRGGTWDRVRNNPEHLWGASKKTLEVCRKQSQRLRADGKKLHAAWRSADLKKTLAQFSESREGWTGDAVEAWRIDAFNVYNNALSLPRDPNVEWLSGEIDLRFMLFDQASLIKFWLHEVRTSAMPRHWLVWAFEFLQRLHKVTDGTPADAQLGTYLVDADLVMSADKVFISIAERCHIDAPFLTARPQLVPAGEGAVAVVISALQASKGLGVK